MNQDWNRWVEAFSASQAEKKVDTVVIELQRRILVDFGRYLERNPCPLMDLTSTEINAWRATEPLRRSGPNWRGVCARTVSALLQFLESNGTIERNPFGGARKAAARSRKALEVSVEYFTQLLAPDEGLTDVRSVRIRLMLLLVKNFGLDIDQVRLARLDCIQPEQKTICHGSDGSDVSPIGEALWSEVERYLKVARPMIVGGGKSPYLFPVAAGALLPLGPHEFWREVRYYAGTRGLRTTFSGTGMRQALYHR